VIRESDKISEHGVFQDRCIFFFFLQRKSRKRKFHRLRHFEGEEERSLRIYDTYTELIRLFLFFVSKCERHARREVVAIPRITFRSSKSRNFVLRNASLFFVQFCSVSLQPREHGAHACTVRGHICTAPHLPACLPASVFRERANMREREKKRDFASFSIYFIAPSVLPFAFHSVANRHFLGFIISIIRNSMYSYLFFITSAPIFTK